jgi:hypothetical protein
MTSRVNLIPRGGKLTTLFAVGVIVMAATAAMAQNPYGYGAYYGELGVAVPHAYDNGETRETGYGQGGTAGLYPTGANVGPGRAAMVHATGQ